MKKINSVILAIAFVLISLAVAGAESPAVRIKDIAHILGARENQLMGFGLVVGLNNTGDKTQTGFTQQALTSLLSRMGVVPQTVDFKSRNVAAVMVTATLPPYGKSGQKLDVTVSSVGDATSLQGGTLLITPLQGVDDQVYAVAQGNLTVGVDAQAPGNIAYYNKQLQSTVGRIPGGALIEKEVPVDLAGKGGVTIVLNEPDFTTANRVVTSIRRAGLDAAARDAGTVTVPLATEDTVGLISRIEGLTVAPDTVAKIVINERTGTVVIGENVVLAPVAVSYGGIDVLIGDLALYSEGWQGEAATDQARFTAQGRAKVKKREGKLTALPAALTLSTLVRALNTIGAAPKDLVAILQALKKAGAIKGELEVI
jgi:flagellar P-ring protein FlgI